ncbi:MAG: tRNA pseudouridine(38-40) synthase TruA, partial [Mycobacteriales bacterium]
SYRVADATSAQGPLRRHDTVWHPRALSLRAMRLASKPLVGEHDFVAFCRQRAGATTVRTIRRLSWTRGADGVLLATVEANAFCHQMVRSLVGALLAVGDGRRPLEWPGSLLSAPSRVPGVQVAPAHGLTLCAVGYPRGG